MYSISLWRYVVSTDPSI